MHSFSSVWDAIEPTSDEAATWRLRSDLMGAIRAAVDGWALAPDVAALRLGLDGAEMEALSRGHIDALTLDRLVAVAFRAGFTLRLEGVNAAA